MRWVVRRLLLEMSTGMQPNERVTCFDELKLRLTRIRAKDEHGRLPSRSRSRSRHRKHDDRDRSRDRKSGGGLRARSRSIIDRFRSKSGVRNDHDDRSERSERSKRDDRDRHHDSDSHYDSDDRRKRRDRSRDSRRPDHGYKVHEEYDHYTDSGSELEGSPVVQRRRRTTKRRDY